MIVPGGYLFMKKRLLISTVLMTVTLLTACSSGVSKEAYQSLEAQASQAESQVNEINSKNKELNASYESMSSEYVAYKESMKEYEDLAEAEASARKASAAAEEESINASKAAEKESITASKAAEEEAIAASKAAEEAKGYETGITYDQLARTPDEFKSKKVKFTGKVLQVMEGSIASDPAIRLAVNKDYDTVIYGKYPSQIISSRILEDDVITIYGTSYGLQSYQSTLGGTITIPYVYIDKIEY